MKSCPKCGAKLEDNARFCLTCGTEYRVPKPAAPASGTPDALPADAAENPLLGDKNLINESTIIGKQEKYEASNITINNTVTEDHSHMTVVCSISGKRVYMDHSVICPECSKPVALEYYVEASKRCERCEERAREAFRTTAAAILAEGVLDVVRKERLDAAARSVRLSEDAQREILRSLQKRTPASAAKLSPVQEAELETAVKWLMRLNVPTQQKQALASLAVLHENTGNYAVDFWYYLGRALVTPEESIRSSEEELTDNYWQRYWGYLAYCITGSPKGSAAVERLRGTFGDREDDIRLAEASYCMTRWFTSGDPSMMEHAGELAAKIRPGSLSRPLVFVYRTLRRILDEPIRLETQYDSEEMFVLLCLFRAGSYFKYLKTRAQEQERRMAAERERVEQERQVAEEARRKRRADEEAERSRRMEQEIARLQGVSVSGESKTFAGYETVAPEGKRRGGWKRTLWIILVILILIIIALFLIPVPESWT